MSDALKTRVRYSNYGDNRLTLRCLLGPNDKKERVLGFSIPLQLYFEAGDELEFHEHNIPPDAREITHQDYERFQWYGKAHRGSGYGVARSLVAVFDSKTMQSLTESKRTMDDRLKEVFPNLDSDLQNISNHLRFPDHVKLPDEDW